MWVLWSYHEGLQSREEEGADHVEWGLLASLSAGRPWRRQQATGASAGRWCSHWAASGGSPGLQCLESHGWGRGRGEGMPGWGQGGGASNMLLYGMEREERLSGHRNSSNTKSNGQRPHIFSYLYDFLVWLKLFTRFVSTVKLYVVSNIYYIGVNDSVFPCNMQQTMSFNAFWHILWSCNAFLMKHLSIKLFWSIHFQSIWFIQPRLNLYLTGSNCLKKHAKL